MIHILEVFDNTIAILKEKIQDKNIAKYCISLNNRDEIELVIISNNSKEEIFLNLPETINLTILSTEELDEDYFYSQKFNNEGNEIINYTNSRRKLTNLLNPENDFVPEIPVITFYSYKGGMGRSTNLVITASHLARNYQKKIIIIDCDFEAPGFSNFFSEEPSEPRYTNGLMEYFFDKDSSHKINLNDYSWEVSKDYSKDGEIRIIPAGNLDIKNDINNTEFPTNLSHYLEGLARLDFASTESVVEKFRILIDDIKKQYSPDAIFIDSRTGFTDIFGIAALKLSTQVVGFFSNSAQNDPGIYQFVTSIGNLIITKKNLNPPIIVNSFSDPDFFKEFRLKVDEMIQNNYFNNELFQLSPIYYYFRYNQTLSEMGTKRERKDDWLNQVDNKVFYNGYVDVAEKINDFIISDKSESLDNDIIPSIYGEIKESISINNCQTFENNEISDENTFLDLQKNILEKLQENWPDLYADSETVDYQKEFDEKRIFYRDSMKDIFNLKKFIVLGNKGTGKSYLFQALKNSDITYELKKQAQKTNSNIEFLHLVDQKDKYFISTKGLESFQKEVENIGDFYTKFWKVYTWRSIIDKIQNVSSFNSKIETTFEIKNDDTNNLKNLVHFINNIDNIIRVEQELKELDDILNSKEIDIIGIYDNLDLMVEPFKWKDQMASLINFWKFSNFKRIHSKLFLRSDLYKTIRGINNVQSLRNDIISIEWQKEEIFNYFFNFVKQYSKENFIKAVKNYDFTKISDDELGWLKEFEKKFSNEKQYQFEEVILRKLCWVFFGQYPNIIKAHGESYDWLYKNVMNADETISIRPFLDLLSLSIKEYFADYNKESSSFPSVLPAKYYTAKTVRSEAVKNHFSDLITEKGNEDLEHVFDFIDKNEEFQYYQLPRENFNRLLNNVISKHSLDCTTEELEELLKINGIVKQIGNFQYSFAFLYKYRLGLKNRKKKRYKH
ncbi:KGGVGR-motif variant AAA ATPase [Myroides guanonis]|uniref:CobQ/CobB/MinD/ParA nucleotide binding domain-containing protein n=1 Tax=Myroides guanonis TaxID=1150112 RepID=A0A1I3LMQ9_9FLAO|nr:hypothetical protein [Myroides guanonis]SFI86011.1 hypothetical protein SAMN04487893_101399 [Myroides guanonis]